MKTALKIKKLRKVIQLNVRNFPKLLIAKSSSVFKKSAKKYFL
ncbi:hypothetical protein ACF3OB_01670 [Capnocytophaga canis]